MPNKPLDSPQRQALIRQLVAAYQEELQNSLITGPQTLDQIEINAEIIGQQVKKLVLHATLEEIGTGEGEKNQPLLLRKTGAL